MTYSSLNWVLVLFCFGNSSHVERTNRTNVMRTGQTDGMHIIHSFLASNSKSPVSAFFMRALDFAVILLMTCKIAYNWHDEVAIYLWMLIFFVSFAVSKTAQIARWSIAWPCMTNSNAFGLCCVVLRCITLSANDFILHSKKINRELYRI